MVALILWCSFHLKEVVNVLRPHANDGDDLFCGALIIENQQVVSAILDFKAFTEFDLPTILPVDLV